MFEIRFATVLPGSKSFKLGNVNATFRGQILLADGTVKNAVIKDLNHNELANEILGTVLARALNLPTPDAYLAIVRGSDLMVIEAPALADGNRLVFASVDVKVPNITSYFTNSSPDGRLQLFLDVLAWSDLGHLYAFDAWTANIDRHAGNLLFGGKNEIWLIDHGHCFSGPDWQAQGSDPNGNYVNRLAEWLTPHLTFDQKKKRSAEVLRFCKLIAAIDVSDASEKSRIEVLISSDHIAAVEAFLHARSKNVVFYANQALGVPTLL